jgi:hypothetical protein
MKTLIVGALLAILSACTSTKVVPSPPMEPRAEPL